MFQSNWRVRVVGNVLNRMDHIFGYLLKQLDRFIFITIITIEVVAISLIVITTTTTIIIIG